MNRLDVAAVATNNVNGDASAIIWLGAATPLMDTVGQEFITCHVTTIEATLHALHHGLATCLVVDVPNTTLNLGTLLASINEQWPFVHVIALTTDRSTPVPPEVSRILPRENSKELLGDVIRAALAETKKPPTLVDYYTLQERMRHLEGLVQTSVTLSGGSDVGALLKNVHSMGQIAVGADRVVVLLANDDYSTLKDVLDIGVPQAYLDVCHAHLRDLNLERRMMYVGDEVLLRERVPGILPGVIRVREAEAAEAWSYMRLPLNIGPQLIGFVAFFADRPGEFNGAHLQLGRLFATQIAEAFRAMRQYMRLNSAEERQRAITAVAQALAEDLELDDVLSQIVEHAVNLVQGQSGLVVLVEPDRSLTIRALCNLDPGWLGHAIPQGVGQAGMVALTGRPSIIENYGRWTHANPELRASIGDHAALIGVPLIYRGLTLGVLQVVFHAAPPGTLDDVRDVLMMLAPQAATAIAKAQLHETVRQEQRQLQAILDQSPAGVLVFDPQGRVLRANREASRILGLLRLPVESIEGHNINRLLGDFLPAADRAMLFSDTRAVEISLGSAGVFLVTVAPIRSEDGTTEAYIAVAHDVGALRRLDQMRANLHRVLTHDLGNLIMLARSPLELLDEPDLTDQQREQLKHMLSDSLIRMQHLISDVTNLEMADSLGHDTFAPYDLAGLVRRSILQNNANAQSAELTLEFEVVEAPPKPLQGHTVLIMQAIDNLVSNAIKYTPPGGRVTVTVALEDEFAVVRVQDTGYGIPEDQIENIYRPFVRVRDANTRDIPGTGLGLSLVKAFVETHGGHITTESVVGEGSTFALFLPLNSLAAPRTLDGSVPHLDLSTRVNALTRGE